MAAKVNPAVSVQREQAAAHEREAKKAGYTILHSGMAVKLAAAGALPTNLLGAMIGCLTRSEAQTFKRTCCCCGKPIAQQRGAMFAKGSSLGAVGAVNVCVRGERGTKGTVVDGCYEALQLAYATRAMESLGLTIPVGV